MLLDVLRKFDYHIVQTLGGENLDLLGLHEMT